MRQVCDRTQTNVNSNRSQVKQVIINLHAHNRSKIWERNDIDNSLVRAPTIRVETINDGCSNTFGCYIFVLYQKLVRFIRLPELVATHISSHRLEFDSHTNTHMANLSHTGNIIRPSHLFDSTNYANQWCRWWWCYASDPMAHCIRNANVPLYCRRQNGLLDRIDFTNNIALVSIYGLIQHDDTCNFMLFTLKIRYHVSSF